MTRVLVAEDNMTLLENIVFELEMRDYQVTQAMNGQEAIEALGKLDTPPDIIVSDIAMPDMDGYKLLEEIRRKDEWQAIPFIFLTAFDSPNAVRMGKELGVDDYLVKPFDPDDLVVAIENKLKRTQQMQQQAERRLDGARRDLINLIAHELRTPMTSIHGGLDMLERNLSEVPDEMTHQLLELMNAGTKRMNRLVNRVVMMVQIQSGYLQRALAKSTTAVDMNKLVGDVLEDYSESMAASGMSVEVQLADGTLPVRGMDDFLKLAISELLDNALKFSHQTKNVLLETRLKGDSALIIIRDKGLGIPESHLSSIWDSFVQVNRKVYEQQGIGLGLTLVREIMAAHGGRCEIESKPDEGTTAIITLPLAQAT